MAAVLNAGGGGDFLAGDSQAQAAKASARTNSVFGFIGAKTVRPRAGPSTNFPSPVLLKPVLRRPCEEMVEK